MSGPRFGRRGFVLAGGIAVLARGVRAAPGGLIPRWKFFSAPDYARVTISPDGAKIAYLAAVDGVLNVWVAPVADPKAGKALTKVTDRDVLTQLWWTGDSQHVVFCREQGGDENWQTHCVDIDSGEIRPLSPGSGVKSTVTSIRSPRGRTPTPVDRRLPPVSMTGTGRMYARRRASFLILRLAFCSRLRSSNEML